MANRLSNHINFIQYSILQCILDEAFTIITNNALIKQHLSSFTITRQLQILNNITHQSQFVPPRCIIFEDLEALPLNEDSLMPVTHLQTHNNFRQTNKTISKDSKKSSNGMLKAKMLTEKAQLPAYKSISKQLNLNESKRKENQVSQDVNDYILRLRTHKEQEERERLAHPITEVRKHKSKPLKGQRIVFDYEGGFEKGKELKNTQFDQPVLSSSIEKNTKNDKGPKQPQNMTILTKINEKSTRNRSDLRKQFEASGQQKRQLILNSLKLSDSKTKMIFDGHPVTQKQSNANSSHKSEIITPMKNRSSVRGGMIPTEPNQQNSQKEKIDVLQMQISLSVKGKEERHQRSRVNTQVTERNKKQRINIESESLKKVLLTEVEHGHFDLPKNRMHRAITNVTAVSSSNDADLMKIKERLNIKTSNQKLPKILSRYSNLEKDILKQLRKKSRIERQKVIDS